MPLRKALALAALTGLSSHAAGQSCDWTLEAAPNPGGSLILFGLDAGDPGELWTAGIRTVFEFSGVDQFNYLARWDGEAWIETPAPQPSTLRNGNFLSDVVSIAPADAIAVGSYNPSSGASQAQSMRWDGSSWTLMNSPSYSGGSGFSAVGRAGNDVWAVGSKYSELPPPAATNYPLAARLNGNSWEVVFVEPLALTGGRSFNSLRAIEGVASDDAWAVGVAQETGFVFGPAAMMVRWDGDQWSQHDIFPLLDSTGFSGLADLAAISSDDVWAVGWDYDNARQLTIPLILHWDGAEWSKSELPSFEFSAELRAVAARGPEDVYAAGTQPDADGYPHALVLHFDGESWAEVPQAEVGDFGTWFRALDFDGDTLWASGQANDLSDGLAQRRTPCDPSCPADLVQDGQLNFSDVTAFLVAFSSQDAAADFNPDGSFDFSDVTAFLAAFAAGCP